ncbi:lef-10 [Mamestra brassicae multiple nucleopolyhedrovirus]|uniref:Lef-10 n=1 Tax=Mamestra brassicae nuclear polyhedrosis virus TaxID=78219 RepID=I3XME2_NPVMB|nr:lef-10 [Mamestra brassicae multiple nucleopolyhedrovirus]AFL64975.1 lef-10 [Mamestra brassicae multiple nucleopolyhedrovirus]WRQ96698.1 lef-10 [Mamestra configurata nucleopolyhedrovirus B]WRQ96859.1 lef-10 [Mamestra configurata nucleopolyhedrovirus B]WRQ97023.1 lef-10 [Mamestra configurata nucleopolyhedrovirus B]
MSEVSATTDVVANILKHNLELIDNSYIILNVVDQTCGALKPVCLGEINSFQTNKTTGYPVSDTSVASELQSDQTL